MTGTRVASMLLAVVALGLANPALAGPADQLVVEKLTDPDPGYVPPPRQRERARLARKADDNPTLDQAFESLGRAAGQIAQIEDQRNQAERKRLLQMACKTIESARSSGVDVSAWDEDCR